MVNLASVEEILADIGKVYEDIEQIADNTKMLNTHSRDMKEGLGYFRYKLRGILDYWYMDAESCSAI